jgi:hypothetical protein
LSRPGASSMRSWPTSTKSSKRTMGLATRGQLCNLPCSRSWCKCNAAKEMGNNRIVIPPSSSPELAPRHHQLMGARAKTTDAPVRARTLMPTSTQKVTPRHSSGGCRKT